MTTPKPTAPLVSVMAGNVCLGHLIKRGPQGFQAYDRDDRSLGLFPSSSQAAAALSVKGEALK